ncbi:hypothetical protein GCM10009745_25230 [Kribbella yunnanensis]|uniref:FAD/NAD(P)-binding domain-containing protein n=2 Tax=Kribbella yunnanensis TaxID=190194 RepID=A0ABP4T0C3_9ACTN
MAAALAAADGGASVVLVDAGRALGGQFHRQAAAEFGVRRKSFVGDRVLSHELITYLPESSVWAIEGTRLWVQSGAADAAERSVFAVDGRAVVLATGAYDRFLPFPGWDLPGVYTAGAAQALAKGQRVAVGRRVVVAGTGPFLLPVASSLIGVGAAVVGLFEANRLSTVVRGWAPDTLVAVSKLGEAAGYARTLARHRVPLRHGWTVVAAHGTDRVEAVTIARLDAGWTPIPGTERRLECDAVCVGFGFTPQLELAVAAGCNLTDDALAVVVDSNQQTTTPGVFAAGELTGIGGADLSAAEGQIAGAAAARHASAARRESEPETPKPTAGATAAATPTGTPAATSAGASAGTPATTSAGASAATPGTSAATPAATSAGTPATTSAGASAPTPISTTAGTSAATSSITTTITPANATTAGTSTTAADKRLERLRRFAVALGRAYPVRGGWKGWSGDDTVVCRCEEVCRGDVEAVGGVGGRAFRLSSRVGLGLCQGRVCSRNVAELVGDSPLMKRPIAVPVRLGDLAEAEETL